MKKEQSITELWDNFKQPNTYVIEVPQRMERVQKKLFEEIMARTFPN